MSDDSENAETEDVEAAAEDVEEEPEVEETEDAEETEAEEGGLRAGDVIRLAYTARTVDDGTLVDTTSEEVAEEEGVADQGEFAPRVLVLGEGMLFEEVEEHVIGGEVGDTGSVVIEQAFGEYDQEEVRTVSADKIPEDDRFPGAQVQIDQEQGRLETIVGGRARVDFNHPLAGEDVEYEYEVVELVDDPLEKAQGLMNLYLDLDLEMWLQTDEVEEEQLIDDEEDDEAAESEDDEVEPKFETITVEKESLYIEATPQLSMNQQWMFQKSQIAQQVIEHTGIDRIVIQEVLDGQPGMGGMGGMMGGMGGMGGASEEDIEEAIEDMDVDADEIVEEIEGASEV
jgi:FKBP-type peptidyl-prolyl cis-trans isomerase SlyD